MRIGRVPMQRLLSIPAGVKISSHTHIRVKVVIVLICCCVMARWQPVYYQPWLVMLEAEQLLSVTVNMVLLANKTDLALHLFTSSFKAELTILKTSSWVTVFLLSKCKWPYPLPRWPHTKQEVRLDKHVGLVSALPVRSSANLSTTAWCNDDTRLWKLCEPFSPRMSAET